MSWLDQQVSKYTTHREVTGVAVPIGIILQATREIKLIREMRALEQADSNYRKTLVALKDKLPCFSPAALLESREKDNVIVTKFSGLMQMDFDHKDIKDWDLEELKSAVFALPFTAYCGLSCSGTGFYALISIAEPGRLRQYAEYCFEMFGRKGIKVDTSKGRNPQDLRYISFDDNALIRANPETLRITHFKTNLAHPKPRPKTNPSGNNSRLIESQLNRIRSAQKGNRWLSVQQCAYTLGGLNNDDIIDLIVSEIEANPEFEGEHPKYCKCAVDCFADGSKRPLNEKN